MLTLTLIALALALFPARVFRANLRVYRPPATASVAQPISVLIPARNEEAKIGPSVRAVLANEGVEFEVVVLDDHSEDGTAQIVEEIARDDGRVRLVRAPELPVGWCGKQYACWTLSKVARYPLLVFLDADVRLEPDALARMSAFLDASRADLASGIPQQITVGLAEKLLIPLIHFILLGFLPIWRMRRNKRPSYSAGCGQLFIARREAYERCGGHSAIRTTLHDGIKLPRAFRAAGLRTDLFDATELASCRMYRSAGEVWQGLAKNAGEALAAPALIVPITLILLGGQVLPVTLLGMALLSWPDPWPPLTLCLAALATFACYYPRIAAVIRFRQSLLGAILHPLGILGFVTLQWFAFFRNALGIPARWKGRPYSRPNESSRSLSAREAEVPV
jgi:hypothetical protein